MSNKLKKFKDVYKSSFARYLFIMLSGFHLQDEFRPLKGGNKSICSWSSNFRELEGAAAITKLVSLWVFIELLPVTCLLLQRLGCCCW